jgi:hypothetical protein
MKNILIAAVALSTLSAPAFAQTVAFTGSSGASCSTATVANITIAGTGLSGPGGTFTKTNLDGQEAAVGALTCNGVNATVSVAATNLGNTDVQAIGQGAIGAGFRRAIAYDATLTLDGFSQKLASTGVTDSSGGSATGADLGLTAATGGKVVISNSGLPNSGTILVAGAYSGSVVITIAPGA